MPYINIMLPDHEQLLCVVAIAKDRHDRRNELMPKRRVSVENRHRIVTAIYEEHVLRRK